MKKLGIDVGGSGIKGAIVDLDKGELITERFRIETPQPATPKAVAEIVKEIADHFKWKEEIGIGFPAVVQQGVVHTASNIDDSWIEVEADILFSDITGRECHLINDADAAGLAEIKYGKGNQQSGTVVLVTIGTGLGTALFRDGKLVPNMELGHIKVKKKTAEHYASDAVRKAEGLKWKKWGKRFSKYLKRLEELIWPDLIILGGGASKKFHKYEKKLKNKTTVVPAELLNEAGIIGAALAVESQNIDVSK
jgi:polyphosphate glucokinase